MEDDFTNNITSETFHEHEFDYDIEMPTKMPPTANSDIFCWTQNCRKMILQKQSKNHVEFNAFFEKCWKKNFHFDEFL